MANMMEAQIIEELEVIKEELRYIKEHMVDVDMILSPEEETILKEGIEEFEREETVGLVDLKRRTT
ncbi:MAG: hypothetical protein ACE5KV_01465 [Thermoplasmata archaeon]